MGTHPIFESDFDCLTEMASRVQGGAAARPWWHNPDLDMPVEDIATFYRDHTNKLAKLQKQKEKERKKEQKKKARKQRKRDRGEETSSDDSDKSSGSSSGTEDYDSDMEPEGLDLTKDLRPLTYYPTRREICSNMFKIIRGDVFQKMVPEKFKHLPADEIKEKLIEQMDGLSRKRINHVLQYGVDMDFSSGESDVDSEEEVERFKRAQERAEKEKRKPIQSSQIDSTEDLVVPRVEDLDNMTLEEITELREKIRKKVEVVQEEELVSQAKKQEQDDDYEYHWAEADPEEEELKKVDEIVTAAKVDPSAVKEESSDESEDESSESSDEEEVSEAQLKLKAKALALAKAKIMAAKRLKAEADKKKEAEKAQQEADDSDVSVDRNEDDNDSDVAVNRDETALVPTENAQTGEAPVFEYATGVAPDIMYKSKEPEELPEPEQTTEELQEELQNDLKQRALTAMNKKRFEKLKAKAQGTKNTFISRLCPWPKNSSSIHVIFI